MTPPKVVCLLRPAVGAVCGTRLPTRALLSALSGSIVAAQRSDNGSYVCKLNISGMEVVSDPISVQLEGELQDRRGSGDMLAHCALAE